MYWRDGISDFRVASCDWPVTTARLLSARHRGNFNFVFISDRFAGGPPSRASLYEKSRAWTKGAAEENLFEASLAESENLSPFFIRPASIDPRYHREIHQWLPDIGTKPKWKSPEKSLRWKRMSDLAIDTYKVTPTRECTFWVKFYSAFRKWEFLPHFLELSHTFLCLKAIMIRRLLTRWHISGSHYRLLGDVPSRQRKAQETRRPSKQKGIEDVLCKTHSEDWG